MHGIKVWKQKKPLKQRSRLNGSLHNLIQKFTMMIVDIEESRSWTSDAMHNLPIHSGFLLKKTCLICHGDSHVNLWTSPPQILYKVSYALLILEDLLPEHLSHNNAIHREDWNSLLSQHQKKLLDDSVAASVSEVGFLNLMRINQAFNVNRRSTSRIVKTDDPNITMEEYIRLEEEKACRRGKVFNWETDKYGKIWYDKDVQDLRSIETEFPAIVFDDAFTSEVTPSYEPTVIPLNDNKIDFRISFDESDDKDYTVIYDENSFSFKIIFVNDLKTNSKNDNDKVNMPSFPSLEPTVSYFDDLDFFKDFEKKFPAIVYNDALTSKSDFLTETTVSPQHIDEFDLKDETSLSEYTDNDNDKIDIEQPSGDMSVIPSPNVINIDAQWSNKLFETSHDTSNKFFKTETFVKELDCNVVTCNFFKKGMPFVFLIKNLYVPFGIPFDPKLFYKDGIKLGQV
ncbi:hypothetical protein Tco_0499295 [Tanacetum coccineum]